jgi:hypothetical protein
MKSERRSLAMFAAMRRAPRGSVGVPPRGAQALASVYFEEEPGRFCARREVAAFAAGGGIHSA